MGLAASQARLLSLTARQSDSEFRGQQISNRRLILTYDMESIAKAYSEGMSNRKLVMKLEPGTTKITSFDSKTLAGLGFDLASSNGVGLAKEVAAPVFPATVGIPTGNYLDQSGNVLSNDDIEQRLRLGTIHVVNANDKAPNGLYNLTFDWRTDSTQTFVDQLDTSDDAAVTAKYEADSAKVQGADKRLEMELKQLDTEHKAIETEVEAVKVLDYEHVVGQDSLTRLDVRNRYKNKKNKSRNKNIHDTPYGFGTGITFETKLGIMSVSYALGKEFDNPIYFRNGKIHFGIINYF